MSQNALWLIVGLGNPGSRYIKTRHNVGFLMVERLADKFGIPLSENKFKTRFGRGTISGIRAILAQPIDFMNRSGPPAYQLAHYFSIPIENMMIIHDDIDIELGRIKIKAKGGHGGHNGIKSIINAFGTGDFPRVRIGVGRPEAPVDATDYVLGKLTGEELKSLTPVLQSAEDAVETILLKGTTVAMNLFN